MDLTKRFAGTLDRCKPSAAPTDEKQAEVLFPGCVRMITPVIGISRAWKVFLHDEMLMQRATISERNPGNEMLKQSKKAITRDFGHPRANARAVVCCGVRGSPPLEAPESVSVYAFVFNLTERRASASPRRPPCPPSGQACRTATGTARARGARPRPETTRMPD